MEKHTNTAPRPDTVPVYVYDDAIVRAAHREKMHWIGHVALLVVIVLVVGGFLWYLSQYEYVNNESVTADGATGVANYIGKDGNIYNGEDSSGENPIPQEEERQSEGNP